MDNIKQVVHDDFVNLIEDKDTYFEEFYKHNYKLVYRICFSILKNTENSEDMAQTVFEKILKMDKDKYPTQYESSWLYTVAKNECLQFLRKSKTTQGDEALENVKSENNEIENVIDNEDYDNLVKKLNKKQEQIVSLRVVSEFTFKEIGQIMSMPLATVQWYYYSSIKSLKGALASMAMFIVAFVIGMKYIDTGEDEVDLSGKKINETQNDSGDSIAEEPKNVENESSISSNVNKDRPRDVNTVIGMTENGTTMSTDSGEGHNHKNIGIYSVCGIFLTLTIIFSIIFIKHQQNVKNKTSKK